MPHTTGNKSKLYEARQTIADLQAEIDRLRTLLAQANKERMQAYPTRNRIIAGFGRDWSQGFKKPVLSVPLQEVYLAEKQELLSA